MSAPAAPGRSTAVMFVKPSRIHLTARLTEGPVRYRSGKSLYDRLH